MIVGLASPPTSGWQALPSSFASDSATLILRLVILFIVVTIAGCGLRLNMQKWSSLSPPASAQIRPTRASDGMLQNQKLPVQNWPDYLESELFC
jgi:hypothetical protein